MIEVWQAKDDLPDDMLSGPVGHMGGLLCRRHAQHLCACPGRPSDGLDDRTGDLASAEDHLPLSCLLVMDRDHQS